MKKLFALLALLALAAIPAFSQASSIYLVDYFPIRDGLLRQKIYLKGTPLHGFTRGLSGAWYWGRGRRSSCPNPGCNAHPDP
jgi:hypothetical protein